VIDQLVDLAARFDTTSAEIAATVHYASDELRKDMNRTPTVAEVVNYVDGWKIHRKPRLDRSDILRAIVNLGMRGWLKVDPDSATAQDVDRIVMAGSLS
jgi:hypothetical protein